jgi:hypothetical protein
MGGVMEMHQFQKQKQAMSPRQIQYEPVLERR